MPAGKAWHTRGELISNRHMLNLLDRISDRVWETAGTIFGLSACVFIAIQLYHEWLNEMPSSLSWFHLVGFTFVYLFWFFYGLRFRHIGVWLPNAVATFLQAMLLICVAIKNIG